MEPASFDDPQVKQICANLSTTASLAPYLGNPSLFERNDSVTSTEVEAAYLAAPTAHWDMTSLMRTVRPDLMARLKRERAARPAGDAA
jgi:hypothetical protein